MSNIIFTRKQVSQMNDLLYMAQKRLICPSPHDINMASSLMQEIQNILVSGKGDDESEAMETVCGECGTVLHSSVVDKELHVEPCPKCLNAAVEQRKEKNSMLETFDSLNEEVRTSCRRAV